MNMPMAFRKTYPILHRPNNFHASGWSNVVALYRPEVVAVDDELLWRQLLEVVVHGLVD